MTQIDKDISCGEIWGYDAHLYEGVSMFYSRGGKNFLEGTHFYHDPGGLDIFCIWSGGQEIFLPLGVAHVKFSRWEGGYWKGVT